MASLEESVQELRSRGVAPDLLIETLIGADIGDALAMVFKTAGWTPDNGYAKKLATKHHEAAKEMIREYIGDARAFYEAKEILGRALGLDFNWMMALVYLTAMDIAVSKKAAELGITDKLKDGRHKPGDMLFQEVIQMTRKTPSKLGAARALKDEYRNIVVHRGQELADTTVTELKLFMKDLLSELDFRI